MPYLIVASVNNVTPKSNYSCIQCTNQMHFNSLINQFCPILNTSGGGSTQGYVIYRQLGRYKKGVTQDAFFSQLFRKAELSTNGGIF